MGTDDDKKSVAFRAPDTLIESLEELKPLLEELPEYAVHGTLSRSALLRIAVLHGVHRLRAILADRVDDPDQVDLLSSPQEELLSDEPNG